MTGLCWLHCRLRLCRGEGRMAGRYCLKFRLWLCRRGGSGEVGWLVYADFTVG